MDLTAELREQERIDEHEDSRIEVTQSKQK